MRRLLNWVRGLFGRRRTTRLCASRDWLVTTEDGTIIEGVVSVTVSWESGRQTLSFEVRDTADFEARLVNSRARFRPVEPIEEATDASA